MLRDRDIVFLSSVEWDRLWQGHHELASRLAANGNRVLYVENIGVRAPRWDDRSRVLARLSRWSRGLPRGGVSQVAERLWVTSPLLMPPFGPRARAVNRHLMIAALAGTVRRLGLRDPILWTYLPTDTALDLIDRLRTPRSLVVYSCLAEFAELVADRDALARTEQTLLAASDCVFALPALVKRCARHSDRVVPWSPAVNTEHFDPSRELPRTAALSGLPRPVIGYVGGIHRHFDLDLVDALARARPQWSWALVGPAQVPVDQLAQKPNVRLVGAMPHAELPGAVAAFDAGIVPYRLNRYTASAVPTKIGEYLAMGKPVVSTPIPSAVDLAEHSGGVVSTAGPDAPAILAALERALTLTSHADAAERCRSLAMTGAWTHRLEEMSAALVASARPAQPVAHDGDEPANVRLSGDDLRQRNSVGAYNERGGYGAHHVASQRSQGRTGDP